MIAKLDKETLYLILKQNHKNYKPYRHHLVEDGADKPHFEYLTGNHPYNDKCQHSEEYIDCTRLLHYLIQIIQEHCYNDYIERILYAEWCHSNRL